MHLKLQIFLRLGSCNKPQELINESEDRESIIRSRQNLPQMVDHTNNNENKKITMFVKFKKSKNWK